MTTERDHLAIPLTPRTKTPETRRVASGHGPVAPKRQGKQRPNWGPHGSCTKPFATRETGLELAQKQRRPKLACQQKTMQTTPKNGAREDDDG